MLLRVLLLLLAAGRNCWTALFVLPDGHTLPPPTAPLPPLLLPHPGAQAVDLFRASGPAASVPALAGGAGDRRAVDRPHHPHLYITPLERECLLSTHSQTCRATGMARICPPCEGVLA